MFYRIANAISVVAGILGLPALAWQISGNPLVAAGTGAAALLLLGIPALQFLARPGFQRRLGTTHSKSSFVIPKKFERVVIAPDYSALVSTEKHFLFLQPAAPNDLVDTIEVTPDCTIDETIYRSSNSSIREVVRRSPSVVAIYWKPKKSLELFVPHIHRSEYNAPPGSEYGPGYFFQGYQCDARTGFCDWKFSCPDPVQEAIAFTLPRRSDRVSLPLLWKFYAQGRRDCAQPVISEQRYEVEWHLANPTVGTTYFCIVVYEGGRQIFRAQSQQESDA